MPEFHADSLTGAIHLATHCFRYSPALEKSLDFKKIEKQRQRYPFVERVRQRDVLLVGEGNFSFALSLVKRATPLKHRVYATSFTSVAKAPTRTRQNAEEIKRFGGQVQTGIDATKLSQYFSSKTFDIIIFQFPNIASRVPIYGQNPNHWLVTRFLRSALAHLRPAGEIAITTVDNPHYEGVFKMKEAARKVGLSAPDIFDFDPDDFPEYTHENTLGGTSAIQQQGSFATFVFKQ